MNEDRKPDIRILVVDDDPDIRFATARILRNAGYSVEEAESGEDCLKQVKENAPDLVLLDVVMPDIDGDEVCRLIKSGSKTAGTFVVLISGQRTSSDDKSVGLETGSDGYIVRPVSKRELLAWIQSISRIIEAERERDRLIEALSETMERLETLQGILPICSGCKKIRDDNNEWTDIDVYVTDRSKASFTHGFCPECLARLYPDMQTGREPQ